MASSSKTIRSIPIQSPNTMQPQSNLPGRTLYPLPARPISHSGALALPPPPAQHNSTQLPPSVSQPGASHAASRPKPPHHPSHFPVARNVANTNTVDLTYSNLLKSASSGHIVFRIWTSASTSPLQLTEGDMDRSGFSAPAGAYHRLGPAGYRALTKGLADNAPVVPLSATATTQGELMSLQLACL